MIQYNIHNIKYTIHNFTPTSGWYLGIFSSKVGQTDLVFVSYEGSLLTVYRQDYKSLCAVVTICATLLDPKLDFYILAPVTWKRRSNLK